MTTTVLPSVQQVFSFILQKTGFCLEDFRAIHTHHRGLGYLPGYAQQTACSSSLADFKQLQIISVFKLTAERSCCALGSRRTKGWKDPAELLYHKPFPQHQSCNLAGYRMRQQQPARRGHG